MLRAERSVFLLAQVVEVKKREHESLESLVRRFHKKIIASGLLVTAKRGRFYERPKSKQRKRTDAIRRSELRREREILRKLGKLEERSRDRRGEAL